MGTLGANIQVHILVGITGRALGALGKITHDYNLWVKRASVGLGGWRLHLIVDYSSTIISNPPNIARLPSNGMGLTSGCRRGSDMTLFIPSSRTAREGQIIQENSTVSSGWHFTAMGIEVISPSGTPSPQQSTILSAPCSLNTTAAARACLI